MKEDISLGEWLEYWLQFYEKPFIKPTTYVSYKGYIDNHFTYINPIPLKEINAQTLQKLCNDLTLKLSPKTVRNIFICLKTAFKQAVIDNLIKFNPVENIKLPKQIKSEIEILNESEKEKLLKITYTMEYGVFIRLVLCTGLRIGELLGLKWEDINFSNKTLSVKRTLSRVKNFDENIASKTIIAFHEPKTKNAKRTIPLPSNAIEDLLIWKNHQKKHIGKSEFVVTSKKGKYLDPTSIRTKYKEMLKKGEIKHKTFHALRHTFATTALEKGMDVKTLSEILGHYCVAFTMDTYVHVLNSYKKREMDKMNHIYLQSKPEPIVLIFCPCKDKFIVTSPIENDFIFIANDISEGVLSIKQFENKDELRTNIDIDNFMSGLKRNDILIIIRLFYFLVRTIYQIRKSVV